MAKKSKETLKANHLRRKSAAKKWQTALETPMGRFHAWMNMLFVDHGILRVFYLNRHPLGKTDWRSAQPTPYQLKWFKDQGVKTVVSLRGGENFGSYPLELEACDELGLSFEKLLLHSRGLPSPERFLEIIAQLRALEGPVLFHCKSGADRAGLASVLHMHINEGQPMEQAFAQLSSKFGHFKSARTGVLDAMVETYLRDKGDSELSLEDWIKTSYDPKRIAAEFKPVGLWAAVVDRVLKRE